MSVHRKLRDSYETGSTGTQTQALVGTTPWARRRTRRSTPGSSGQYRRPWGHRGGGTGVDTQEEEDMRLHRVRGRRAHRVRGRRARRAHRERGSREREGRRAVGRGGRRPGGRRPGDRDYRGGNRWVGTKGQDMGTERHRDGNRWVGTEKWGQGDTQEDTRGGTPGGTPGGTRGGTRGDIRGKEHKGTPGGTHRDGCTWTQTLSGGYYGNMANRT